MIKLPPAKTGFIPADYQKITVNPDAYDSGGSSLARMGKSLQRLGDDFKHMSKTQARADAQAQEQAIADEEKRQDQRNTLIYALNVKDGLDRDLLVGDDPYLQSKGAQAVALHGAVQEKLSENHQTIRALLPDDGAREYFDNAARAMDEPLQRVIATHLQQQKIQARRDVADHAQAESLKTFVAFRDQPDIADLAWKSGEAEAIRSALLNPDPAVTPEKSVAEWRSKAHSAVITDTLQKNDPERAQSYLLDNKAQISEQDYQAIQPHVALAMTRHQVRQTIEPLTLRLDSWKERMGQAPENRTTAPFAVPTTTTVHSETDPAIAAPVPQPLPRPTSPLRQGQFYGLQDLDDLQDAYDAMARKQNFTPEQFAIGLADLRQRHSQTLVQARQYHTELLTEGFGWLDQGNTVETLSPDITRHLPPRSLAGLKRQQEINYGLRPQATDFSTAIWLGTLPPAAFSQRLTLEDRPYLSPVGRQMVDSIQTALNHGDITQQQRGQACLSVMSKINQAVLTGGPVMQDPALLDTLHQQAFQRIDTLLAQSGSLTDAQAWAAVSPVILDHVKSRLKTGDGFTPDFDTVSAEHISAKTGIPADMVMPTWRSMMENPEAEPSLEALADHYLKDPAAILSRALGHPYKAMQPVVQAVQRTGAVPSLANVLSTWEQFARHMPAHWF